MTDKVKLVNDSRSFNTQTSENILSAGLRQGIVIPHNCRNGFCGSCMGLLHSGQVEYEGDEKPSALTEEKEKAGYVLCCQAHTKGDIELEVETIDAVADIEIKTLPCRSCHHMITLFFMQDSTWIFYCVMADAAVFPWRIRLQQMVLSSCIYGKFLEAFLPVRSLMK
jgi:ferredoxin